MSSVIADLRKTHEEGILLSIDKRISVLKDFLQFLNKEEDNLIQCLYNDLGKPKQEAYSCEIASVKYEISHIIKNLHSWNKDSSVNKTFVFMTDSCYTTYQPYGVVLVIGSWNYPINVPISSCIGALSAGNTVLIKPSELSPYTTEFLRKNLPKYVNKKIVDIFTGGPQVTEKLLEKEKFDFIIFTGSKHVGKIIMRAAAEKLTPVCLELGGKCPVYIDKSANLELTANRLIWGKFTNAGQTCVAPDYVLCHESVMNESIDLFKKKILEFYGPDPKESPNYSRIINKKHLSYLGNLINETNGRLDTGGEVDIEKKYISPTIISKIHVDDVLMKDEIFGPILPIISVSNRDQAIKIVKKFEKPLSIYIFSNDKSIMPLWIKSTSSGSIVQNDCIIQAANPLLPFGGVGESGMGAYKGEHSFKLFSHRKSVLDKSTIQYTDSLRLPPYTEKSFEWSRWALKSSNCSIM